MSNRPRTLHDVLPSDRAGADAAALVSVLDTLRGRGLAVAPHVAARLSRALGGDLVAIAEVAASLTPSQRRGHRSLPSPLPVVPRIAALFDHASWSAEDRRLLLTAVLATDDTVAHLAAACGVEPARLEALPQLEIDRGHARLRDPRLAVWLQETSTAVQRAQAHADLERAHADRGQRNHAAWHRARGARRAQPDVAGPLVRVAVSLLRAGHAEWAFRVAAEASDHAVGGLRGLARLVAGEAALGAGYIEDAAGWLRSVLADGSGERRARAMSGLFVAEAQLHGSVPALDPREHRPVVGDAAVWAAWARACGVAAVLCAERGARRAMRGWLAEVREADAKAGVAVRDPVLALCRLLGEEPDDEAESAPSGGVIADALRAALGGDIDRGLQLIVSTESALSDATDPLTPGLERSALIAAYRAVVEVLLLFWRGQVARARERLIEAAGTLPLALPFAGLGVVLARRLDLAVLGRQSALADALTASLPAGTRIDRLVDGALEAYLAGRMEDAAEGMRLWGDRGAPATALTVPGLDEAGPLRLPGGLEPPELAQARALRHSIRSSTEASWQRDHLAFAEQARTITSPFTRARIEALLGATCVIRDDRGAGRRHLRAARSLFDDAGADAWRDAVERRLARLDEQLATAAHPPTVPIQVRSADPLATCRAAWAPLLTDRELEVAMLIVSGAANREIGDRLGVSVRTVEVHASRIFTKLGVRGRVELTGLAHRTNQFL